MEREKKHFLGYNTDKMKVWECMLINTHIIMFDSIVVESDRMRHVLSISFLC